MGRCFAPLQGSSRCRLSRFLGVFRPSLRFRDRRFPGAETRHSAVPISPRRGHRTNKGAENQSDYCRAISQSENCGESGERDRGESRRFFAVSRRSAWDGDVRAVDRHFGVATGCRFEMKMRFRISPLVGKARCAVRTKSRLNRQEGRRGAVFLP